VEGKTVYWQFKTLYHSLCMVNPVPVNVQYINIFTSQLKPFTRLCVVTSLHRFKTFTSMNDKIPIPVYVPYTSLCILYQFMYPLPVYVTEG